MMQQSLLSVVNPTSEQGIIGDTTEQGHCFKSVSLT